MSAQKLKGYGGKVLADGTLEMQDLSDSARHRYQYKRIGGLPCRRVLPERGDCDPPAQWEVFDLSGIVVAARGGYSPILDYFGG